MLPSNNFEAFVTFDESCHAFLALVSYSQIENHIFYVKPAKKSLQPTNIYDLCDDHIAQIFKYLDINDWMNLCETTKRLRKIVIEDVEYLFRNVFRAKTIGIKFMGEFDCLDTVLAQNPNLEKIVFYNSDNFDIKIYEQLKLEKMKLNATEPKPLIIFVEYKVADEVKNELSDKYEAQFISIESISKFSSKYGNIF